MKTYTERPTPRRARQVWDYMTKRRGREPKKLWKNPNCWGHFGFADNLWGWWVGDFGGSIKWRYEDLAPQDLSPLTALDKDK